MRISVFQALTILIRNYRNDLSRQTVISDCMHLYLDGVKTSKHRKVLSYLLQDPCLQGFEVSDEASDIDNDPVRRYFEGQLCYETLLVCIDELDLTLLNDYLQAMRDIKIGAEEVSYDEPSIFAKTTEKLMAADSYPVFKPDFSINGKDPIDIWHSRKEKILVIDTLIRESFSVIAGTRRRYPLRLRRNGLFKDENRGRIIKDEVSKSHALGIMKSYMPIPQNDPLFSEVESTRIVDRLTYENLSIVPALAFSTKVAPFCGSISGTLLCQLQVIAYLHRHDNFVYENNRTQFILFLKSWMAYMHYIGTHSLDEFITVLHIEQVQDEFSWLPEFASLTLNSLFKKGNDFAFTRALNNTIEYLGIILAKKQLLIYLSIMRLGRKTREPIQEDKFIPHAIHYLAQTGQIHIVKVLLDREPKLVNRVILGNNMTPLMYATYSGSPEMILLLLSRGADIYFKNNHNFTALSIARGLGNELIAFILLNHAGIVQESKEQSTNSEITYYSDPVDSTNSYNNRFFASRIRHLIGNNPGISFQEQARFLK